MSATETPEPATETPQRSDARRNRAAIVDAARALAAGGVVHPPVRAIVDRAGVSRATFYRHFGSVEEVARLARKDTTDCREILARGMGHPDPWTGFSIAFVDLSVAQAVRRGDRPARGVGDVEARRSSLPALGRLVERAREADVLAPDVTLSDVTLGLSACAGVDVVADARRAAAHRLAILLLHSFGKVDAPA